MGTSAGVFLVLLFLVLLGAAMLLGGLVGRRVGDHAHCRGCSYDLSGIAQGITQCPECGRDLSRPRATRIGMRKRRPWLASFGALVLLLGLVPLLVRGAPAVFRSQPTWMLRLESRADGPLAQNAVAELLNRRRRGQLNDATTTAIASDMLLRQADPKRTWVPAMGELIGLAARDGLLSQEQAGEFYTNGIGLGVTMRDVLRTGTPTSVSISLRDNRLSSGGRFDFATASVALKFVDSSGKVVEGGAPDRKLAYVVLSGGVNGGYTTQVPVEVPPGQYTLEGEVTVAMRAAGLSEPLRRVVPLQPTPVKVVGPGEPLVELGTVASNSADLPAVVRAIRPVKVRVNKGRLFVLFSEGATPMPLIGRLVAEQEGSGGPQTIELLDVAMLVGSGGGQASAYDTDAKPGLTPGPARLWFEPDIERGERMVGLKQMWGERIDLGSIVIVSE